MTSIEIQQCLKFCCKMNNHDENQTFNSSQELLENINFINGLFE